MALPVRQQLKYWGIAFAIFAVVLWFLGDVLLPFVLGSAIAYALDPVADRLEKWGFSRAAATATITIACIVLFIVVLLPAARMLVDQLTQLFSIAPELFLDLRAFLTEKFPTLMSEGGALHSALASIGDTIKQKGGTVVETALTSVGSLLNILMLFLIVPVVTVYMLLDWDRMTAKVDDLVPLDHKETIRHLAREIDGVLAGFIRGMGSVMVILGTYYAVLLWLVGLQFGLVVGVAAGMLTFIPYVGAIVGGGLAIGLALFQFWGEWWWIVAVWAIFQSGQFLEGNVITPRLVGDSVGLHPVWLLLALSVFGALFGFIGLLVAVPLAAALGVIVRFLGQQYKGSKLYLGYSAERDGVEK
ncbi:AI-2E family transporter [Sagittula sp. NFXS13]|uniref:Putative PurR-regulated permease PerM n=1 Tax=Sagittula marina TaxID=943940 RepID=A0A7W6GRS5_9RHOB|nr:AI-2E family transporter [Sagittula marina]MBB3985651.1 putative PurR-regulated permease PerM [Sagittula marina]